MPESGETQPICAMRLGDLRVDFMPDDEEVLGFTNRWYKGAMETAMPHALTDEITIYLVAPVFFLATKLEAYKGLEDDSFEYAVASQARGNADRESLIFERLGELAALLS